MMRALLVLALAGLLAACSQSTASIDFSQTEGEATPSVAAPSDNVIRMAVAPVLSPVPTFSLYQELADYIAEKLERPVEMIQGKTYEEINNLVKSGEAPLAVVCTNPYLQGKEDFGMEALVVPQVDGETYYYSLLIVRDGLEATSLEDLRGHTFAFTDPLSNTGRLAPLYKLAVMDETPDAFFDHTLFTYAHDHSIRAVAEGVVDAAAVDSLVYDYLDVTDSDLSSRVTVIDRWGPYGINPVVVSPLLDQELKAELRRVLTGMDDDPLGQEILQDLMIDRFLPPDDSLYASVLDMRTFLRERGLGP
jgi:phosphonate transport system substrate-binding protein